VDWATDVRTPTVAEALELQETIDLVMAQLDPDAKTVFQLRLQGHDPLEISESINRTERTVRRKLSNAREVLLRVLSDSQ
jgi:RNA polymerase sigma factor (sigma-70 family)